jgi:hypothetical protein
MVRSRTRDSRKRPNDKSSVVFHSEMIQAFAKENHLHGQSELVISIIAQHWKMRLKPEHRVILQTLVILRPKYGMQMRLIQRNVR